MLRSWSNYIFKTSNEGTFDLSEDELSASFIHPGLSLSSFSRPGEWDIPDIRATLNYFTEVRNLLLFTYKGPQGGNLFDFPKLMKGGLIFVLSSEFQFTRDFYDKTLPKWPLKVEVSMGSVGRSSFCVPVKLSLPGKEETPISTQISSYVIVDKDTRQSKQLPDWFRDKYKDKGFLTAPNRVETLNRPSDCFHFSTEVLRSDTDSNNHTNYATYVHYTTNALRAALRPQQSEQSLSDTDKNMISKNLQTASCAAAQIARGPVKGLKGISAPVVDSGLKTLRICYSKESLEGDRLDIFLWQEEGAVLEVKAVVEKNHVPLCHIHLEYFGAASQSNL